MKKHSRGSVTVIILVLLLFLLVCINVAAANGNGPSAAVRKPIAKNIIVLIADGRGFNHVEASGYYTYGKKGMSVYERFPVKLAMSTYMDYEEGEPCYGWGYDPAAAWGSFDHVKSCYTDSAAAATAMSTGVKSYYGAIGVDMDMNPLPNLLEMAEDKGKSTGVITSVEWTHATPAGFVAHNISRNNYEEIGQEMVYSSAVDVIMGAGHPWFDHDGVSKDTPNTFKYVGGETTWDELVAGIAGGDADGDGADDPWVLIQTRAEFQSLMSGPTPTRVLGTAQVYQTLQSNRSGDSTADPFVVPLTESVPTLEEMTKAALNILDDDVDGFFLMIEGGAIDWASHGSQSGRMIEEHMDFDNATLAVVDWVKENSNWGETLVVVTSDHETGYLTGLGSDPSWMPVINNGAGVLPGMEWHSADHTNSLVPFYAKGDGGRIFKRYANENDPVYGFYLDNIEMADGIRWVMEP